MSCPICDKDPSSHSFKLISKKDNINYFYTCPARASKYNDTQGILFHYRSYLQTNYPQPWIWIFDSKDFSAKHTLNIELAYKLSKLIDEFSSTLQKIEIINPTWHVKVMIKIVEPFLEERTKKLIRINN